MTDEERKRLCDYLRYPTGRHDADILDRLCKEAEKAADEIERLAKENKFLQFQLNGLRDLWTERQRTEEEGATKMNIELSRDDLALICDSLNHERDLWIKVHAAIGGSDAETRMNQTLALVTRLRARLVEEDGDPT
jgi:hypothetical protein